MFVFLPGFSMKDNAAINTFSHISWYMCLRTFLTSIAKMWIKHIFTFPLACCMPKYFPKCLYQSVSHQHQMWTHLLHVLTWHFQIFKFGSYLHYCFKYFSSSCTIPSFLFSVFDTFLRHISWLSKNNVFHLLLLSKKCFHLGLPTS